MSRAITVDEAAELLRVDRKTVYDAIKTGQLPSLTIGRVIRLSEAKVIALLEGQGGLVPKGKQRR